MTHITSHRRSGKLWRSIMAAIATAAMALSPGAAAYAADADATEQSAAAPKKPFALTDTEQAAKYIGDSCAGALMDAWRAFAAEKEGGADADSALFSRDHVTHNDDGTVTFTVWMPSSQKTYRGVADMAAGSVSFSE